MLELNVLASPVLQCGFNYYTQVPQHCRIPVQQNRCSRHHRRSW